MIIGKLFDEYSIDFPLEKEIVAIVSENSTGKTKLLELLNEYLLKNNHDEKTIYLPEYRTKEFSSKDINALKMLLRLQEKSYDESDFEFSKYYKKGTYITSGQEQFVNMIYHASLCDNLLIDFPERNLDIYKQKKLINSIFKFNLKRLIIVTHSPIILHDNENIHVYCLSNILNSMTISKRNI